MTEEYSSSNQARAEPIPPTPAHGDPSVAPASPAESDAPDARGVPVPSDVPAEGTSEGAEPVDGVRTTALAPEGHADGETDQRMPPTTTF